VLIQDLRRAARPARYRRQPILPYVNCDLRALLAEVHEQRTPEVCRRPGIFFVEQGWLACIVESQETNPAIYLHGILDNLEVPQAVFRFILTHELIHLLVPSAEVNGKMTSHPPRFREREQRLCPELPTVWEWIWQHLWRTLVIDRKAEGLRVRRDWARVLGRPRTVRVEFPPPVDFF